MVTSTPSPAVPPPPAQVPDNRWDLLEVPELGSWTPERRVSVILPHYEAPDALSITLSALAEQTYPTGLFEVIVADDGSTRRPTVPDDLADGPDVRVVTQERRGFGAGRARNTGARAATGDVLVFLDGDMVPEAGHVEAHARWHHVASDLVVVGFRRHADFDHLSAAEVRAAVAARELADRFRGRPVKEPEWIEGHMTRTSELRSADDDLFRVVTSGNLSLRAETFWRVGGFDETFTQWGGEDTELGYRLFVDGDVLVPERAATCWHQGYGHEPDPKELASLEDQRARLAHLIAHRGFRRSIGRIYERPRVAVHVDAAGARRAEIAACVDSTLSNHFHDLRVLLTLPPDHGDRVWLERQYAPDPRVDVADRHEEAPRHTPIQIELAPAAVLEPDALDRIVSLLESADPPVGAVHATVTGQDPGDAMLHARRTRALHRAARVAQVGGSDTHAVLGELFGERWVSGAQLGVRAVDAAIGDVPRLAGGTTVGVSSAELHSAYALFSSLDAGTRQQVVGLARRVLTATTPRQRDVLLAFVKRVLALFSAARRVIRPLTGGGR